MGSIAIRTISKRFLHGNLMRQTCIRNTESLSPRHHSSKTRVSYTLYKPSPSHPFSTSSSGPSCSNSKSNSGFIGWYLNQLESHQLSQKLSLLSLFTLLLISPLSSGERGDEIVARLKRDLLPTLRNGLLYWPACDFATYKFVLVHPQPLVNIICSYVWTIYLTCMASSKKASTD